MFSSFPYYFTPMTNSKIKYKTEIETFYPASRKHWRQWLQKNHNKKQAVWFIGYKKKANTPTLSWSDAVDEALCFGWIDSIRKTVDHEKFMQYFSRRKPTSAWSKINKEKVKRLIDEGLMVQAGLDVIEVARKNGTWKILDTVEELKIPADLNKAFKAQPHAKKFFLSLSKSQRKMMLQWIAFAKRDETRLKRINELVTSAAKNVKPKQFQ